MLVNYVADFMHRQQATMSTMEFESDSHVLTEVIRIKYSGNSKFCLIIADITQIMLSCVNFKMKFVRRHANIIAHTLARTVNYWTSFYIIEIFPYVFNVY
jgi:hypothetical protein